MRVIRICLGVVLVLVAIVCALTGLRLESDGSSAHAAGQLFGCAVLALIFGAVGIKMMLRRAPR
jgi:hypothetical protein